MVPTNPLEFVDERGDEQTACRTEGMAHGNRATFRVQPHLRRKV